MFAKFLSTAVTALTLLVLHASATTAPFGAPNAPSKLTVNQTPAYEARLRWQDNSTNETGFLIQRQMRYPSGAWGDLNKIWVQGANITSFFDDPYPNKRPRTVRYRVCAHNGPLYSSWTAWRQVTLY